MQSPFRGKILGLLVKPPHVATESISCKPCSPLCSRMGLAGSTAEFQSFILEREESMQKSTVCPLVGPAGLGAVPQPACRAGTCWGCLKQQSHLCTSSSHGANEAVLRSSLQEHGAAAGSGAHGFPPGRLLCGACPR